MKSEALRECHPSRPPFKADFSASVVLNERIGPQSDYTNSQLERALLRNTIVIFRLNADDNLVMLTVNK